jgi:hypothetical protein
MTIMTKNGESGFYYEVEVNGVLVAVYTPVAGGGEIIGVVPKWLKLGMNNPQRESVAEHLAQYRADFSGEPTSYYIEDEDLGPRPISPEREQFLREKLGLSENDRIETVQSVRLDPWRHGVPDTFEAGKFAKSRHIPSSNYSHFDGTWEELEQLVANNFCHAKPGYRDGVMEVPVPAARFFSPSMPVREGMEIRGEAKARRPDEEVVSTKHTIGPKFPAVSVIVIVYSHDLLVKGNEAETDADWEIITVNASVAPEPEPMDPVTMARNFLGKVGGTPATYTAEEFATAIWFDTTHVKTRPVQGPSMVGILSACWHRVVDLFAANALYPDETAAAMKILINLTRCGFVPSREEGHEIATNLVWEVMDQI